MSVLGRCRVGSTTGMGTCGVERAGALGESSSRKSLSFCRHSVYDCWVLDLGSGSWDVVVSTIPENLDGSFGFVGALLVGWNGLDSDLLLLQEL